MPISKDWHIAVELKLAQLMKNKNVMTYLEMAEHAKIPSPYRIHQLAEFLEHLISIDVNLGQPIRAARVVSKKDKLPADGFFDCLARHGRTPSPPEAHLEFHQRLLSE